ncbi:MAG: patatin-like phospholipase family protein [Clostridium sp.]|nr:patatin-like phospholipase family protein [Clostridium sp.]
MKLPRLLLTVVVIILSVVSLRGETPRVGLVLSGGGAKGVAHIGVIKALEENDIPIDCIAGTSMGAIVGGLYAAGYSPEEMMALLTSEGFQYWSTGKIDKRLLYYFSENEPTPALGKISVGSRDTSELASFLPSSLISPLPMNFAFMDLFAAYSAQCDGDFDRLFVPFRCVTSDVYEKHKIVLRSGSLGDAIRASMSFPVVFHPIEIDSVLCFDGGIYDNFPVDVMHDEFAPSIMIGSNVSGPNHKPTPDNLFGQLEDMIIQNNDYSLPADEGIKIDVPVRMFGLLDFDKAAEIYEIGYRTALSMIDSIKTRVRPRVSGETRRSRRLAFKAATPRVRFDSVEVEGATPRQNEYVRYLFTHNQPDTFGLRRARDAYYRALTPGRLRNLVPLAVPDSATGIFRLCLRATAKEDFNIGLGGYVSSGTSSMLFLSAGYNTLSFNSPEMNLNAWAGQSYLAGLFNAKMNLRTDNPSRFHLQIAATRHRFYENDQLFFEDNEPVFITRSEIFGRAIYEWAAGQRGRVSAGIGWGHLTDRFYHNNTTLFSRRSRDIATQNLGELRAAYEFSTLDNLSAPTSGASYKITAIAVTGNYNYDPGEPLFTHEHRRRHWFQAELATGNYLDLSRRFSLGFETNLLWSGRRLLTNYYQTIVEAPSFNPTPSSYNSFNPALHANAWAAAAVVPVLKLSSMVQVRGSFWGYLPFRAIKAADDGRFGARYGRWFADPEFFGEVSAVVTLPFATVSGYANYISSPARNWNFGLTFGLFFLAPRFLR